MSDLWPLALESGSAPEDVFAELFTQAFGLDKALRLVPQYPVKDIDGRSRFVDFALRTLDHNVAFEIDGLTWHVPDPDRIQKYEDDLLKQNSLVHLGWLVFRWTDRQIAQEPERIKEQLALFLERIPGLLDFEDFLPRQRGGVLELKGHQKEALAALAELRAGRNTIALLTHATGTGKIVTAISDARHLGGRTLFIVHTKELAEQARDAFAELWPDVDVGLFVGQDRDPESFNVVATVQSLSRRLAEFHPDAFAYLVIDEAHHATAESYQRILRYFRPGFTLGLTGTPERADDRSVLEVFRTAAHRIGLREAVECGELVPIRCVRVRTNVDLSRVRFNQVQYNRRDIEQSIVVPGRDRLIVETYRQHVPGRKAVAFCVNVRHGEDPARCFTQAGFPAKSVSGRMSTIQREEAFKGFANSELKVLCACDMLNEGWDCPEVEVLLMARPTLSRVIYLQQLGRGTRKAPGKDCLIVFDFVDNATRYSQSLDLHRVLGLPRYRAGALALAPADEMASEEALLANGGVPCHILPIELWAKDYEEINVFNWQEAARGMISASDLEVRLATSAGRIRNAIERQIIEPDHTLRLGDRAYYFFKEERAEEVRERLGLPAVEEHTLRDRFLEFVRQMDMSSSYKPVMLEALFSHLDENGRAPIDAVARAFHDFYLGRHARGETLERPSARMARASELANEEVRSLMLGMPFEKFERRGFMRYDHQDLAYIRIDPRLWRQMTRIDIEGITIACHEAIERYFRNLDRE